MPLIVALALSLWLAVLPARAQELEFFTIGAGDVSGSYYASATAICASVNRSGAGRVRCSPDPTAGSIYNLDALRTGQIDFALVQSDWQRQALEGTGRFAATGPMEDLRSVMGLYPESVTLLARDGLGITAAQDLAGLRIDIGHPSSGRHATNLQLLQALGMSRDSFELVAELPVGSAVDELCSGRIDATLLVVGHPNGGVGRALRECDIALLPVTGTELDAFLAENPDYVPQYIPISTYPGLTSDIRTFAVTATLVTRAAMPDELVAGLVGTVVENLPAIGLRAPVLAGLDPANLPVRGLTAPLHPAAKAAFESAPAD